MLTPAWYGKRNEVLRNSVNRRRGFDVIEAAMSKIKQARAGSSTGQVETGYRLNEATTNGERTDNEGSPKASLNVLCLVPGARIDCNLVELWCKEA